MSIRKSTFIRSLSHFGFFRIRGKDAAALLHHLTTNDINSMQPDTSLEAVLLTNKARCMDILTIARRGNEFLVITSPNRRDMFLPHARSYIVFRQDVQIENINDQIHCIGIFGPDVAAHLPATPEIGQLVATTLNNVAVEILPTQRLPHGGYFILSCNNVAETLSLPACDNETYNILRVEAGLPVAGLEITEAHNPWEANLDGMISLHKGCYNGQEIVARLHTYQKVKQHLKGLRLSDAIPSNAQTTLQSNGKSAGEITSTVTSPEFGNIALAYVRNDATEPLKVLFDNTEISATVVNLPFGTS